MLLYPYFLFLSLLLVSFAFPSILMKFTLLITKKIAGDHGATGLDHIISGGPLINHGF